MLSLFKQYADSGKIREALMVGQNMINKAPEDKQSFETYFSFLCNLAKSLPALDDRMRYFDQANIVLSFFVENAKLDKETIEEVVMCQNWLEGIRKNIEVDQETRNQKETEETRRKNDAQLKRLYVLKDELCRTKTKEDFDKVLKDIRDVDALIDKSSLTEKQNEAYDDLTKENTEIMNEKMRELEHKDRIDYNKRAAESYRKAFKLFQSNESKYKNQTQLFSLASTTLFAYDASKLFNETLIYYNHVYSYIFAKLDDDGKLALTKFSIECERNLR